MMKDLLLCKIHCN